MGKDFSGHGVQPLQVGMRGTFGFGDLHGLSQVCWRRLPIFLLLVFLIGEPMNV